MRPTLMNRFLFAVTAALLALPLALVPPARAQESAPPGQADRFKDTSILKLPAGQKAAIYEFEDLECPACAHAFPIVHAAITHYRIPLIRRDFPLNMHVWSRDAAITARYLEDKVSADLAYQFRRDVFAHQLSISSKDDLQAYTRQWFQAHGQQVPFVMDPVGRFAAEVQGDQTLGERLGVMHTPTVVVVGARGWVEVNDITQLYTTIDRVMAQAPAGAAAAPVHNMHKSPATAKK